MPAELEQAPPFPLELADAYRDLLFHGPLFQGITRIAGMDARGSSATLRASDPGACVAGAGGRPWLLDPVMLDSALQIQVLWARLNWDVTLLPAEIGRYERLACRGPARRSATRCASGRERRADVPLRPLVHRPGRPPAGDPR